MGFHGEALLAPRPTPHAGGPPLVGCPRLLIQFIRIYPPYRRPFLHPQPEDAPCRGDRDPPITWIVQQHSILFLLLTGTCSCSTVHNERVVAFPLRQWLREGATVLRYTHIVISCVFCVDVRCGVLGKTICV